MNPFLLAGPDFLLFFGVALAFVCLLALVSDPVLRRPKGTLTQADLAALGPYSLIYLAGGPIAAVDAAVVSLMHAGLLVFDERSRLARSAEDRAQVGVHAYRSIRFDEHPLESVVLESVDARPQFLDEVRRRARPFTEVLRAELVRRGYVLTPLKRALGRGLGTCWLGVVLWCVGAMRIIQGLSNGRPVAFLLLLMLPLSAFVLKRRRGYPRASYRGAAAVRDQRIENSALATTAMSEPAQVEGREMALAYGLFGAMVLPAALLPVAGSGFASVGVGGRLAGGSAPTAYASCGSSGGCATSAGCGSSCGGGGGGGCGGCGGGCSGS